MSATVSTTMCSPRRKPEWLVSSYDEDHGRTYKSKTNLLRSDLVSIR